MRARTIIVASALMASSLAACVRTTVTPFSDVGRYLAVPVESVVVYRDPAGVPAPFEQLAVVSARGDFTLHDEDDLIRSLRKEAGRLGANGLLVAGVQSPSGAGKVAGVLFGGEHALRRGQALAIRVRADSAGRRLEPH